MVAYMLQYLLIPNQYQGFNIRDSLEKIVSFINMGQCPLPGDPCLITIKMDTLNKKCYLTVEKKRKKKWMSAESQFYKQTKEWNYQYREKKIVRRVGLSFPNLLFRQCSVLLCHSNTKPRGPGARWILQNTDAPEHLPNQPKILTTFNLISRLTFIVLTGIWRILIATSSTRTKHFCITWVFWGIYIVLTVAVRNGTSQH